MHSTLTKVQNHLENLIKQIQSTVPNEEPLGVAHGSWNLPGLTRAEFIETAQSLIDLINGLISSADIPSASSGAATAAKRCRHTCSRWTASERLLSPP